LSDFEELLALLNAHHVRAIIVGGYALAFHGHPRYTKDLGLYVDSASDNTAALLTALDEFGFGGLGLAPADFSAGKVVQLGVAPNRIDLMTSIDGIFVRGRLDRSRCPPRSLRAASLSARRISPSN
jgi:hypothetical protein